MAGSPPPESPRRRASIDGSFRRDMEREPTRESTTRAWQMYIYGGAYPENHLIFTAPSLFTDVPPPVIVINSSHRVRRICFFLHRCWERLNPPWHQKRTSLQREEYPKLARKVFPVDGDRCLVCLSDYEQGEECRTLSGCGHLFHKECIDQVRPSSLPI